MAEISNYSQEDVGQANGSIFAVFGHLKDKTLLAAIIWIHVKINLTGKVWSWEMAH